MKMKLVFIVFSLIMFTGCIDDMAKEAALKEANKVLEATNKKILEQVKNLTLEKEKLNKKMQEQIKNLTLEKEELNKKMRTLESENKELKDEIERFKNRSKNVKALF